MLCFRKIPVAKKFLDREGGERIIEIFRRRLLSQSAEKILKETL